MSAKEYPSAAGKNLEHCATRRANNGNDIYRRESQMQSLVGLIHALELDETPTKSNLKRKLAFAIPSMIVSIHGIR